MPDPVTLIAAAAVAIAIFGAGRFSALYTTTSARKARALARAMAALKEVETLKPDATSAAVAALKERADIDAIKAEADKLAA